MPTSMFEGIYEKALGISRAEMDVRLMNRAAEAGVEVREKTAAAGLIFNNERVTGLKIKNEGVERTIETRLVIDATGRTRSLVRRTEGSRVSRARFVAFKAHARNVDIPDGRCEIFSYRGGYGGTSRVEKGLHNVCFIASATDVKRLASDATRVFREVVCSNRRAAHIFQNIEFQSEWLAVPIERFGRGSLSPITGLLTIGDAAAFIDPFTGSGMLLALESARVASGCITETENIDLLAMNYERQYRAAFDRRLLVCSWLRLASFVPFLADITVAGLGLSSGLKGRLVRATRPETPGSAIR